MKSLLKLWNVLLMVLLLPGIAACSNDDDDNGIPPTVETNTIADFVASNENYSSLEAALEATGLTETLDNSTEYTVFAPDNDAFEAFLSANGFANLEEVPLDLLTRLLLNHVQAGSISSGDLTTGYIESMAVGMAFEENLSMYIDTSDGVMINGVARVVTADVEVDNGVIHAVDAVIGLPDITTFALADPTFEILVNALTREESFSFVETLMMTSDPAPFTVFAPTNDAFSMLLTELDAESLADFPTEVLQNTLSYHVISGANVRSSDLMDDMQAEMLNGEMVIVNLSDAVILTDVNDRMATVVAANVQANNGVIHVIDTVLLPSM
ncbi:fasciclin domain-containing protein [Salinimicrobium sp. GXAS 041]|uniref:fasciclin domain-containing protein n=1 Tax=Salinimicrobium sp. GXAS 041 TaxID=3400806 RepID=UPI003C784EF6